MIELKKKYAFLFNIVLVINVVLAFFAIPFFLPARSSRIFFSMSEFMTLFIVTLIFIALFDFFVQKKWVKIVAYLVIVIGFNIYNFTISHEATGILVIPLISIMIVLPLLGLFYLLKFVSLQLSSGLRKNSTSRPTYIVLSIVITILLLGLSLTFVLHDRHIDKETTHILNYWDAQREGMTICEKYISPFKQYSCKNHVKKMIKRYESQLP